jgi:cytochrome c biogenesis protein CcmG/thiol:disulfide interchange protein DsbE
MRRLISPLPAAVLVGVVALIALLVYGVSSKGSDTGLDRALARGERPEAPALELPPLGGGASRSLADYRGRVVVLNYWASWCDPCRTESPLLERWHGRIRDRGGTVLGVDVLDLSGDARDFIREYGLSYPMLRDRDGETQGRWGITGLPETFVIDPEGRVAALKRGPVDEAFMRQAVEPLLREAS